MPVPKTGQYKIFDVGSENSPINTSIKGAQKYDAGDSVDGNTKFSQNIDDAQVPLFDPAYAGQITSLSNISSSRQWRGYPQEITCYNCSFEEIEDPNNRTIIISASALDEGVYFKVNADGNQSPVNGGVTVSTTKNSTFNSSHLEVGIDETFVGWSFTPEGSTGIIETNQTYNHTVDEDLTIYALVRLSDAIGFDFCYYSTSNMNTICSSCSTTKTVYFDRDLYVTTPIEDLIWYEDTSLSITSDEGYYRKKTIISSTGTNWWNFGTPFTLEPIIDDTIYFVSGSNFTTPGAAEVHDTCGDFIYCNNS